MGPPSNKPWWQQLRWGAGIWARSAVAPGMSAVRPSSEAFAKGSRKVDVEPLGEGVVYSAGQGSCFGWFWLIFTTTHCFFMFSGLSHGTVRANHRVITNPTFMHFFLMGLFYVPFFFVGLAFTVSRFRVELQSDCIAVRWRVLPGVGWTWRLTVAGAVDAVLDYRGARVNKRPVRAVVLKSDGKEIAFGSFLSDDVKEYLAAAVVDYYHGDEPTAAPFIPES